MSAPVQRIPRRFPLALRGAGPIAGLLAALCLGACGGLKAGPDYQRPSAALPDQWAAQGWRTAHPADQAPRGAWWQIYQDPTLDALEEAAAHDNPGDQEALARVRQAQALVGAADAAFRPSATLGANATRTRYSANRPNPAPGTHLVSTVQDEFTPSAVVRWEYDMTGRLQRSEEAAQAALGQSQADRESLRLLISSNLALAYFSLRALDADMQALQTLLQEQERALALISRRVALGYGTALDVQPFQSAVDASRVQLDGLRAQRPPLVNGIAVLTGKPPTTAGVAPGTLAQQIPVPPLALPSELLERRPDIASAERQVAQASAQIGIANAARYPSLLLGGSGGLDSRSLGSLLNASSMAWSLGASLIGTVYDGGRTDSAVAAATAAHEASVAHYRATVPQAISEVENALAAERDGAQSYLSQEQVLRTAQSQLELIKRRQHAGLGTDSDLLAAQQTVTSAERYLQQLRAQRLLTSVYLVKAIGGRW